MHHRKRLKSFTASDRLTTVKMVYANPAESNVFISLSVTLRKFLIPSVPGKR
jgi:hypothetical protein